MGSISFTDLNHDLEYDVLIIGAGLSGIYSLIKMREMGMRVKVIEAGSDVGGTWFWNRYPGARFDSESWTYNFSFSEELLKEWDWSEHFSPQPETLRYIEFVCQKFDVKRDMQFNTRISSAQFQERSRSWLLTDEQGKTYSSRFLITAMGILSNYTLPDIPGVHDFKGLACHTARWPEGVDVRGKRVGIIGTGATGIQTIQEIAKDVGQLTVFQRTPNWSAPLRNAKISKEEMSDIRQRYPQIFQDCKDSYACFVHMAGTKGVLDATPEEREEFWEMLYATPGFRKWLSNYNDIGTNREANKLVSDFFAKKIRERVNDPETAEKLIPKCHGFGTRRVPLETHYFEVYNQDNVRLVDIKSNPIERIHEKGIKTRDEDIELDMIIYATGFDAVTGAFTAVDIQGLNKMALGDKWSEGPRTFLGLTVESFPNMFMVMGPHQMFGNIPRSIEFAVEWISDLIKFCRDNRLTYVEATPKAVDAWTEHVHECAQGLLANEVDSWMTGVNKNLAHKQKRIIARYNGPAPGYRRRIADVAARQYSDMKLE